MQKNFFTRRKKKKGSRVLLNLSFYSFSCQRTRPGEQRSLRAYERIGPRETRFGRWTAGVIKAQRSIKKFYLQRKNNLQFDASELRHSVRVRVPEEAVWQENRRISAYTGKYLKNRKSATLMRSIAYRVK